MPAGGKKYTPRSRLFEQTASKTLGGPLVSTRYQDGSGDTEFTQQLSQTEYDTITNPINLSEENIALLEAVRLVGEVTNRRSSSGPIAGTQYVDDVTGITNSNQDVHRPARGEVYQLIAASIITLDSATSMILNLIDEDGHLVQIDTFNATSNPMELNEPIYYTYEAWLSCRTSNASSGNARLAVSGIRVR